MYELALPLLVAEKILANECARRSVGRKICGLADLEGPRAELQPQEPHIRELHVIYKRPNAKVDRSPQY